MHFAGHTIHMHFAEHTIKHLFLFSVVDKLLQNIRTQSSSCRPLLMEMQLDVIHKKKYHMRLISREGPIYPVFTN